MPLGMIFLDSKKVSNKAMNEVKTTIYIYICNIRYSFYLVIRILTCFFNLIPDGKHSHFSSDQTS